MLIQQDVLRLQIAVNDVSCMEILDSQQYFAGIELGYLFRELLAASQQVKELALHGKWCTPDIRSHSRYNFLSDWKA
jgi:hypothetical protein